MTERFPSSAVLLAAVLLSACSQLPVYQRPAVDVPAAFPAAPAAPAVAASEARDLAWQDFVRDERLRALITQEFLLGITNPKAIILFAAIFPQFIDPAQPAARQFLVLGSIYLGSEFVSTAVYASFGRQIRRFIRTSRGVARLNKATGGFFMGAGGLLLATNR